MKSLAIIAIVCISLMIFPVQIPRQTPIDIQPNMDGSIAQDIVDQLERVYGIDKSRDVFTHISRTSFTNYVKTLTENGSRWIQAPELASTQNSAAREWIIDELTRVSNGRIEIDVIGDYKSVLGRLPGYLPVKAPVLLVGGHYDSVSVSQGANDDGTGVAAMLEIARIMSQYSWPLDIYFGAWNAEELGLFGSKEVSTQFIQQDIDVLVFYNIDMLFVPDPENPTVLMAYQAGPYNVGHYWADLTSMMSKNYGQDIIETISSEYFSAWRRSDHYSFIQDGYGSSLFASESGDVYDSWYHTAGDTWNNPAYDYDIAIQAVKAIGASMAFTMFRTYGEPIRYEKTFDLLPGHENNIYMDITGPTTINVTARWYGGGATFEIYDIYNHRIGSLVSDDSFPWESKLVLRVPVSMEGLYCLRIFNHRGTSTGYDISWEYDTDVNNNGIPDSQEFWIDNEYFQIDTDNDSISDAEEMIIGTSWQSADSDSDLLPDNYEIDNGFDPLNASDAVLDYDGDSLTNLQEYQFGSNPHLVDSDLDQLPDSWEYKYGLNPLVDDSQDDPDNDHLTNIEEYQRGTNPLIADVTPLTLTVVPGIIIGAVVILVVGTSNWIRRR